MTDPPEWAGNLGYGPLVADEGELRLLGNLAGRRVLLLGCGGGHSAAALAAGGARVIAVDASLDAVDATRRVVSARGLTVDAQQRDLAELAFVRAETIDVAVSPLSLADVPDPARVFRQAHRVLRPDAPIVVSLPHPALAMIDAGPATRATTTADDLRVARPYGDRAGEAGGPEGVDDRADGDQASGDQVERQARPDGAAGSHTIEALVTALVRAGFRLDTLLELWARHPGGHLAAGGAGPEASWRPAMALVPAVLVIRARKTGL